ncbi:MAG: hypothetical protein AAGH72_09835 [Verrucomicrobiota bacterium]
MSAVEEIEKAIDSLSRTEFFRLRDWMRQRFDDEWDQQFEEDAQSGRLDALAQQALSEHRAGESRP